VSQAASAAPVVATMASTNGLNEVANACASVASLPPEDPDSGIAVGVAWGIVPNPAPLDAMSVVRQTGTVRETMSTSRGGVVTAVALAVIDVGTISGLLVWIGDNVVTGVGVVDIGSDVGSIVAVGTDS